MNFKEEINKKLSCKKMAMNTDWILNTEIPEIKNYGFYWNIVGSAGSGKSSYLYNLLLNNNGLGKKFDRVYTISPSIHTLPENVRNKLVEERTFNQYDDETLQYILDDAQEYASDDEIIERKEKPTFLLILDDCIAQIKRSSKQMKKFIYNRRHTPEGGNFSVIMTSQKYNNIPLDFRVNQNYLTIFKPSNKKEIKSVFSECIAGLTEEEFNKLIIQFCKERYDNIFISIFSTAENQLYHNFNKIILLYNNGQAEKEGQEDNNSKKDKEAEARTESKPSSKDSNK